MIIPLMLTACAAMSGQVVVVPNPQATAAGNLPITLGANPSRLQQTLGSGQFPAAMKITGLRIRASAGTGRVSFSIPSFQVTLSTTQSYPNTINGHPLPSPTYASNTGPDATLVYNGPFSASSPGCAAPGPCPFDMVLTFATPFSYEPSKGRLLIDWTASAPTETAVGSLDGYAFPDSTTSSIASVCCDSNGATGNVTTSGLVYGLDSNTPIVVSVANAASNRFFSAPLAQGAIIVIKGTNLGPANISIAPRPFQSTNLSGTSVSVTVGTNTVSALLYYTSATQVAALLPSNSPLGAGNFTVTYNGQTSNSVVAGIVRNNPSIFTVDSTGQGPGIVTYADYSLVSAFKAANCGGPNTTCGAANPGDTLILWATGLGPVNGSDAAGAGLGVAMPNVPLKLWMGGVQAPILYQGRSGCCIGEDQIAFTVPDGVPTGCGVPLVMQIGDATNLVSNTTLIPVAKAGRTCAANDATLASINFATFPNPFTLAELLMEKRLTETGGTRDVASYQTLKLSVNPALHPFLAEYVDQLPVGTCKVVDSLDPTSDNFFVDFALLDGGATASIKGPNGTATLPANGDTVTISPTGGFIVSGSFSASANGGKDVGGFSSGAITLNGIPTLTVPSGPITVTRPGIMSIDWRGTDPAGNVQIQLSSATDGSRTRGATAICKAAGNGPTFVIPSYVLGALPAGNLTTLLFGAADQGVPFKASGADVGTFHTQSVTSGIAGITLR